MLYRLWGGLVAKVCERVGYRRSRDLAARFHAHLAPGTVLDLGAGGGHTATILKIDHGLDVTMLDVPPHPGAVGERLFGHPCAKYLGWWHGIPHIFYDGQRLPFEDNSFDNVLVAFVLHHCKDPGSVLREAVRVTRNRLVVLEDFPSSTAEPLVDSIINLEIGNPHNNLPPEQWRALFAECGLSLATETQWTFKVASVPVHSGLFALDKVVEPAKVLPGPGLHTGPKLAVA